MSKDYIKNNKASILGIIINVLALEIVVYGLFKDSQKGALFALGILVFITLYFMISYLITVTKKKFEDIKTNNILILDIKEDLNKLKDNINIIKDTAKLDVRLSFLEGKLLKMKNKKGQIDPRWIILIIIIILTILYLKTKGVF